jgi:ABC-type sugar transport system ATPase subunit
VAVATTRPLLELRKISKSYGRVQALTDVDLEVFPGEVLALVGDNGAGKSTLAKVISGAHQPDDGEIVFDGEAHAIASPSDGKQLGIEMVYQNLGLLENLTVAANIFLGRELRRKVAGRSLPFLDQRGMERRSQALLEQEGAQGISPRRSVAALSGGQRQLVAIARAAGWGHRLIVMDEPTAALGVRESRMVLDLVDHLRSRGVAILVISHNLEHVFEIADRIAVLRRGKSVGTVRTAESRPDEIVRLIVGADAVSAFAVNAPPIGGGTAT